MKKLCELNDKDVGLKPNLDVRFAPRTAARAILMKKNFIALLNVGKNGYYKLPGGGVYSNEKIEECLKREVLEETGCTISLVKDVGEIIEHRSLGKMVQTSYCFIAEVAKEGKPRFTNFEIKYGFKLVWVTINRAINLLKNSKPADYNGKFIVKRDTLFLQEAKRIMLKN